MQEGSLQFACGGYVSVTLHFYWDGDGLAHNAFEYAKSLFALSKRSPDKKDAPLLQFHPGYVLLDFIRDVVQDLWPKEPNLSGWFLSEEWVSGNLWVVEFFEDRIKLQRIDEEVRWSLVKEATAEEVKREFG